jgi:excisionase family DNA binding protein
MKNASNFAPALVSIRDACTLLGVSRTTVYGLIEDGRLPTVHIGRAVRIPREAIDRLVAKGAAR